MHLKTNNYAMNEITEKKTLSQKSKTKHVIIVTLTQCQRCADC